MTCFDLPYVHEVIKWNSQLAMCFQNGMNSYGFHQIKIDYKELRMAPRVLIEGVLDIRRRIVAIVVFRIMWSVITRPLNLFSNRFSKPSRQRQYDYR